MDGVEPLVARERGPLGRRVRLRMLVAFIPLLVLAAPPIPALEPRAERPVYSVGEQWLLKDGVYELTKIEKNRYIWASSAGRQIHLTKDLALASVLKDRVWEWDVTPVPEIAWPLEVGKWGLMHRATLRMRSQPSGIPVRLSWQVKVYEDVRVVGGLFKAFQIVYAANVDTGDPFRGGLQVPGAQSWQVTAWYAPEVRRIVKIQSTSIDALNFEVISLEPPPTVAAAAPPPAAVVPATPPPAAVPARPAGPAARPPATPPAAAPAVPGSGPLQVTISSPKDQQQVSQQTLALAAVASGGKGVSRVVVTLNGVVVARLEERAPQRAMPVNLALKLEEGQNAVVVTATDADGITQQEMRAIHYEKVMPLAIHVALSRGARARDGRGKRGGRGGDVEPGRHRGERHPERHRGASSRRERSPQKSMAVTAPIKLREGANAIVVTARRARRPRPAGGAHGHLERPRRHAGGARRRRRLAPSRDRWAVVIGVGGYESPDMPSLRYTRRRRRGDLPAPDRARRASRRRTCCCSPTRPSASRRCATSSGRSAPSWRARPKGRPGGHLLRGARRARGGPARHRARRAREVPGPERRGPERPLRDRPAHGRAAEHLRPDRGRAGRGVPRRLLQRRRRRAHLRLQATRALRVDDVFLDRLTRSRAARSSPPPAPPRYRSSCPSWATASSPTISCKGSEARRTSTATASCRSRSCTSTWSSRSRRSRAASGGNQHPMMKGEMEGLLPLVKVGGR